MTGTSSFTSISIPFCSICIHHLWPPQPFQPALATPRLLPLKQSPHVFLPKPLHLQFPPSVINHSLPLSIRSLLSTVVSRSLLSSSLLLRESQRHPSPKPMAPNYNTMPWLLHTNVSLHPKTNLTRKATLVAPPQLLLTKQALLCFTGPFHMITPIILLYGFSNSSELTSPKCNQTICLVQVYYSLL
jgi:hypothetical protein